MVGNGNGNRATAGEQSAAAEGSSETSNEVEELDLPTSDVVEEGNPIPPMR
ncbi:hypothetical protein [Corynebacterium sp.]|uniref:hypothetical protein n=1 Tax=Corynebacterium sp. TaxID=1720 RepID=UPI0026E0A888|nr:hypothetical protein [Corynebacterium sp.]MDO5512807.1 hypothetical protein [Corynebacterium sp.]